MLRHHAAALAALLLAVTSLALACGDDDGGSASPSPGTGSPTATGATRSPSPSTSPPDEHKTPVTVTPESSRTPGPTINLTPRPTATEGTPATVPADVGEFLGQFAGKTVDYADCNFNPVTSLADCFAYGRYAPDPPPVGQGIECSAGVVEGAAEFILCTIDEPGQTVYYAIGAEG